MTKPNMNYADLKDSYLFFRIAQKVKKYSGTHPDKKILRLGIGDVSLPLCKSVITALNGAVEEQAEKSTFHGYMPECGAPFLRATIADFYRKCGVNILDDEVFISSGASDELGDILDLFDKENTALVIEPAYPAYVDANIIAGRKIIHLASSENNGFTPDPDESAVADIIYICSPNNPTGAVFTREKLKKWVDFANLHGSVILFDAAYEAFIEDESVPINTQNIAKAFVATDILDIKVGDELDYNKIKALLTQNKSFEAIKLTDTITEGETEMIKFEAVVGNPPYQSETKKTSETNGQNPRTNIFHHFQIQAEMMAKNYSVLIFPGIRWIHQSGKGLKEFGNQLINSKKLKKVVFYPNSRDVFDCADISDGVSIVLIDKEKTSSNFEYEYVTSNNRLKLIQKNPGADLLLINPNDLSIANKIKQFVSSYNLKFLHESILPRSLFGIESDFIEKNNKFARQYTEGENLNINEIKVLTNDKAGPAGRSGWFVIDRNFVKSNAEYIEEWQVVVSSAHPGGQEGRDNQISVIDNQSAFGRARIALKSFKTEEEAKNFFKYANCPLIKYTFLLSHESLSSLAKYVPDILDYTGNNNIRISERKIKRLNDKFFSAVIDTFLPETRSYHNRLNEIEEELEEKKNREEQEAQRAESLRSKYYWSK